jgi:hypothetical protein
MTKKKATTKRKAPAIKMEISNQNTRMAVHDLEIREPINLIRVVGNRLELHLRSGLVYKWPETAAERKKRLAAKPKPKAPPEPPYDSEDRAKET